MLTVVRGLLLPQGGGSFYFLIGGRSWETQPEVASLSRRKFNGHGRTFFFSMPKMGGMNCRFSVD